MKHYSSLDQFGLPKLNSDVQLQIWKMHNEFLEDNALNAGFVIFNVFKVDYFQPSLWIFWSNAFCVPGSISQYILTLYNYKKCPLRVYAVICQTFFVSEFF